MPPDRPDSAGPPAAPDATPASSPDRPRTGPIRQLAPPLRDHADRYELEREPFAHGGMGHIWSAYDHDLDREVAVKALRPELADDLIAYERFAHESWVLAQLDHPGIVPIHDRYLMDDPPCFTMKRVRGESLAARIRRTHAAVGNWGTTEGQAALRELVNVMISICRTVAFAHSRGLVHRDVKPANVLLGDYGEVLVMDWGLAAPTGRPRAGMRTGGYDPQMTESRSRLPQLAGEPLGTPSHMAPEQARGEGDQTDERIDVFGIGATMFELLTNSRPWPGASDTAVAMSSRGVLESPRQRAPQLQVPADLDAVVRHATAATVADRYPDIDGLRQDLQAWLDDRPLTVWRDRWWSRLIKSARRRPTRVSVLVGALGPVTSLLLALLVGGTVFAVMTISRQDRDLQATRSELHRTRAALQTAEVKLAVSRGRLDEVRDMLGMRVADTRSEALRDFQRGLTRAGRSGISEAAWIRSLPADARAEAILAFEQLRERAGDAGRRMTAEDWFHLGLLYALGRGEMDAAVACFDEVLAVAPDSTAALRNRGLALQHAGRSDAAHADFTRALELEPDNLPARQARAELLLTDGRPADALIDTTTATRLADDRWDLWRLHALALAGTGRRDDAVAAFARARELAPPQEQQALRQLERDALADGSGDDRR